MAFWGIEVRSGKPGTLSCSSEKGRFHLTQATLGLSAENTSKPSFVQCNVGNKSGVLICSLVPDKVHMCSLNLEFDEDEEVVFSVLGPHSVHLCGFFEERNPDEYGEDITKESSEDEDEEEDEDLSDADDGFLVADDVSEEEAMILSPEVAPNSGVKIEEVTDEVEAEKEDTQKTKKKKDKKKKKKKQEEKKNDDEEQEDLSPENNGTEKEEENGEDNQMNGDNGEEGVSINGKRKKKSKENVEGEAEAEADAEPPTKKQATEEAVIGVTEEAEVKTSRKKKKSKNKARGKGNAPEE